MKIVDVEIVQALQWPFVRIHTDAGISGIGEASLQQKELAVRTEVMAYRDFLIGQNPFQIEHIWNALHRRTVWSGGPVTMTAISGIEQALWDIKGKAAGMPVYELLGGRVRERVKAYANGWFGGAQTPEEHAEKATAVVADGYDTIKWYPFGLSARASRSAICASRKRRSSMNHCSCGRSGESQSNQHEGLDHEAEHL